MLGRYLRQAGDSGRIGDGVTYAEELLDSTLATVAERLAEGASGDAIEVVANAFVDAEVESGLPAPPSAEAARDQFVRTYVTLALDNDRQAPSVQMSGRDLERPRGLLGSFFTGSATMHADAQSVLRFIEERFAQGRFGQARLLLQLFDTDPLTQRNNERNLFYEEMSQRFLAGRNTPFPEPAEDEPDEDMTPRQVAETLEHAFGIRLHTFGLDSRRQQQWAEVFEAAPPPAREAALRVVPGPRWREHWKKEDPVAAIAEHLGHRGARTFVQNLVRCAYFVTLAPGSTGFEPVVMRFLEWTGETFDVVPTRVLPRLHRDSTLGELSLSDAFDAIWSEHFEGSVALQREYTVDEIRVALDAVCTSLVNADYRDIPQGDYDLGGMVAGRLFGFDPGDATVALRMNRLT